MPVQGHVAERSRTIEPLTSNSRGGLTRPRFLACDIDGTILDGRGRLHPVIGSAIAAIAASGVHVVLATGRSPWRGVADLAARLGLRGPQITMQGALLSEPASGRVHRARPLSPTVYLAALWFADELGLDVVVAMVDGHRVERLPADGALFATPAVQGRDFRYVFGLERLANDHPMRVFIATPPERHLDVRRAALARFEGHASVVWSDQTGIEILAPGTNKGEAVTWLAASLGIGMNEVAAVGDAPNDSEMLRLAGHSAVMRSAPPEVQACARVVVPSADEFGILLAFTWFFPDLVSGFTIEGDAPRSIAV